MMLLEHRVGVDVQREDQHKRLSRCWLAGELYQSGMAATALARHGSATQLKGIVHECAYVINHNTNPFAVARKGFASLSPNSNDQLFDVLFSRASGVQLKDTISTTGARSTALRAASYGTVLGTPETVAAVSSHGVNIECSGVSTAHNGAIAARAGGGHVSLQAVVKSAQIGAVLGALVGALTALVKGHEQVKRGEASWSDVAHDAVRAGIIGGAAGAVACGAGTAAASLCPPGWLGIGVGFGVSVAAGNYTAKVLDENLWPVRTSSFGAVRA
jgi:hypothetical protein